MGQWEVTFTNDGSVRGYIYKWWVSERLHLQMTGQWEVTFTNDDSERLHLQMMGQWEVTFINDGSVRGYIYKWWVSERLHL